MNETILIRMDRKLYAQLDRYAKRDDNGLVSRTARRAIQKFIDEQKQYEKQKQESHQATVAEIEKRQADDTK